MKIYKPLKRIMSCAFAASVVALPSSISVAQQTLEEIVVTATKRAESLQDAPVAVSAFSGDELERQGVTDMAGLANVVPNLTIGTEGARDATYIAIRGVSQSERRNVDDATTPFFIDGATVPRMSGVAAYFYDVERVEVLRGPQGTLYGRNSTTGVVNLVTKKPNFDGFGGDIEVGLGNYDNFTLKGAFNAPLSDSVAARFAYTVQNRDGFRDNGPLVARGDDADDFGIRGHLLWDISSNTSLLLTADYYKKEGVGAVLNGVECALEGCNIGAGLGSDSGGGTDLNTEGFRDNTDTDFKIELNHSFENFDLMALASYRLHERDYLIDNDGSAESFNGIPLDAVVRETTESESWSSEVRLTSTTDGPLQWILGAYLLDETINGDFFFGPVFAADAGSIAAGDHLDLRFIDRDLKIESAAVFGNITYDLSDSLTLRGGIRYTDDEKDKGGIADPANPDAGSYMFVGIVETGAVLGPFPRAQVSNPDWNEVTYNIGLDWVVNDDTLVYAKFSTGYKAGGFNRGSNDGTSGFANVANLNLYDPETVDAYEIGYKASLLNGRARINVAAFYNDYQNKVESAIAIINGVPTNSAVNATSVDITGLEVESSFLYGDSGARFDINLGWLDATYNDFDNLPDSILGGNATLDVSGQPVANAPDWNITINWVPVELEVMDGILRPMLQIAYKSEYRTRPHGLSTDIQDAFTRSNASLFWESNDNALYGEVYVNNIEDEDIQSSSDCQSRTQGPGPAISCYKMYQPPRTFGVKVGYRF